MNADDLRAVAADIRKPRSHAEYVKAWHPGVALAVADWLSAEAAIVAALSQVSPEQAEPRASAIAFVKVWRGES